MMAWPRTTCSFALIWLIGTFGVFTGVQAQTKPVRVSIGKVKGPYYTRVRAAILVALRGESSVQKVHRTPDALIAGSVQELSGGQLRATLEVVDKSGAVRAVKQYKANNDRDLAGKIKSGLWKDLGVAILAEQQRAPPRRRTRRSPDRLRAKPKPAATPSVRARSVSKKRQEDHKIVPIADDPEIERNGRSRMVTAPRLQQPVGNLASDIFRFGIGLGVLSRDLAWNDALTESLASYNLGTAPAFHGQVSWFPGGHLGDGLISQFGLDLEAELPFAMDSRRDGNTFPTAASYWRVGVLARLPWKIVEGQFGIGFVERRFSLDSTVVETGGDVDPLLGLPEVRYQVLSSRLAMLVRVVERIDLRLGAGLGLMLDAGPIDRMFPNGSSYTVDVRSAVTVYLAGGLGVFGQFAWQGAFFDFDASPGDEWVAGGASDNYYVGSLGLSFAAGR